jgi:hypothetical protein
MSLAAAPVVGFGIGASVREELTDDLTGRKWVA